MGDMYKTKIAVIGSGIAGLGVASLLAKKYSVTLFEAAPVLGGHAHTVDVTLGGKAAAVDVGFLVYNDRTYPHLKALFKKLEVPTVASVMSFSVKIEDEGLEWAGTSLGSLFVQKRNLLSPGFWSMLLDIMRFNREAPALLRMETTSNETLGEFLSRRKFGSRFRDHYLLPMAASIWSCPTEQMLAFPAASFFHFLLNHGLLQITDRPQWKTVQGGSREYVKRLAKTVSDIRLNSEVTSVCRTPAGVEIEVAGERHRFDQVVFATHAPDTLRMLQDADATEKEILSGVRYQPNDVVLHTDASFLPKRKAAWSAWNYLSSQGELSQRPVTVSYLINQLQPLPFEEPILVTLNPARAPDPDKVLRKFRFDHPVMDFTALRSQERLGEIQGKRLAWFCGAWTGYGFHEDGLRSAVQVAGQLGVKEGG